ncbi:hypothetical protein [Marinoscillum sp.]|uniref:hypothetical protein n=1 Tax=Marinoscillum sp. TaxID=2024838 RepID=UPI003BAB8478
MKNLFTAAIIGLTVTFATAQQVNYEKVSEEPAFNQVSIMPYLNVYSSLAKTLGAISVGGEAHVRLLPIHLRAHFDYALINASITDANFEAPTTMELGGEFPLITQSVTKKRTFPLKSVGYYNTFIKVPFTFEKSILARGGLMRYTGNFQYGSPATVNEVEAQTFHSGNFSTTGFYLGLTSMQRSSLVMKVSSDTENYGELKKLRYFQLYADILVGVTMDLGTFIDHAGHYGPSGTEYDFKEDSEIKTPNIGLRIGTYYMLMNSGLNNNNGQFIKFEIGTRPAPEGENLWMMVGYGLMFNVAKK